MTEATSDPGSIGIPVDASIPEAVAAATRVSLRLLRDGDAARQQLQALIGQFRQGAADLGLTLADSSTPIQPILVGDSKQALRLSEALWARGILVTAIRPPTVPDGTARLRVTFSAAHQAAHVDRLLEALADILRADSDNLASVSR